MFNTVLHSWRSIITRTDVAFNQHSCGPEKAAQSLMYNHFATVSNRVTRFSQECSEINY